MFFIIKFIYSSTQFRSHLHACTRILLGNLNAHIMRVHNVPDGEPIYGCNYCSCVFKKLGSLNGHMKRMHTDVNEVNHKLPSVYFLRILEYFRIVRPMCSDIFAGERR